MANGIKTYQIKINGVVESIDAVKILNQELDAMDKRIKALQSSKINATSGGGGGSRSASLSEEDKLQKQIAQTEQKRIAYQKEIYQSLLAEKDLLKATIKDQKQLAASERLTANGYSNTMEGMKEKLADIKAVMQTVDLSDTSTFDKLTKEADELNKKLLEIEKSYGQFGRNVGNYATAAEGFKGLTVQIGGVTQEFDNAKQALKTLKTEMQTLSVKKDNGIITAEEEERLNNMIPKVKELESSIQDAGKPMDAILDTMQSVVAIASTAKGFSAIFGLDDNKLNQSIQRLLALQNALQGLQAIQKQMQTGEGIGKIFASGTKLLDGFIIKAQAGGAAMRALGTAAQFAGKAISGIAKAFGWVGIAFAAFEIVKDLISSTSDATHDFSEEVDKLTQKLTTITDTYVGAASDSALMASRIRVLRTEYRQTNDEISKKEIIKEATAEFKKLGISISNTAQAEELLTTDSGKLLSYLSKVGEVAALSAVRMEAFKDKFKSLIMDGQSVNSATVNANEDDFIKNLDKQILEGTRQLEALKDQLGIKDKEIAEQSAKAEEDIAKVRLNAMREGFAKRMLQLNYEKNQRIEEAKKSGRQVGERTLLIEREYNNKMLDERRKYHQELLKLQNQFDESIERQQIATEQRELEWVRQSYDRALKVAIDSMKKYPEAYRKTLDEFRKYSQHVFLTIEQTEWFFSDLNAHYSDNASILSEAISQAKQIVSDGFDDMYLIVNKGMDDFEVVEQTSTEQLRYNIDRRLEARQKYYSEILRLQKENSAKQYELEKRQLDYEYQNEVKEANKRYKALTGEFEKYVNRLTDNGEKAAEATVNPILNALNKYQELMETDNFGTLDKLGIGKALQTELQDIESFINELESGFNEGIYTFEEYNSIMQSSLLETLTKVKTDYENFLSEYNNMSSEMQDANIGQLKHFEDLYYETFATFLDNLKSAQETHNNEMQVLQKSFDEKQKQAKRNQMETDRTSTNEYLSNMVKEYDKAYQAIQNKIDSYQTTNPSAFGFINLPKLKKNLETAKEAVTKQLKQVNDAITETQNRLAANEISSEDAETQIDNLNALGENLKKSLSDIEEKGKEGLDNLVAAIASSIQTIGNSIKTIMDANNTYQDYLFDKMEDDLDKQNDIIKEKLQEQEEILKKHSDKVNDIENELSTARGDRRQHLIDQLNDEIQVQREAAAEKKKLEKEEADNEKKQKELQKQKDIAQYNRNLQSILVSGAMAISNAFATQPFIPVGLAMGALATSLTTYQYLKAKQAKPYATGGIIEGPSHKDGGVKVLGGSVEVEGGEYITNKRTTQQNLPLLEYINSNKKRIDLSDMVEFFNDKPRATIKSINKKFEDGGIMPSAVDIGNQMKDIVLVQSQQPIYVAVTDIERKMEDVRYIRTIAGVSK